MSGRDLNVIVTYLLTYSNWHGYNFCTYLHLAWSFFMFTVWHKFFSLVLMFPELSSEALPHLQYWVSVYTQFLKQTTRKFNVHSYVLNLVQINISFIFQRLIVLGPIYRPSVPHNWIELADLLAIHATLVESSGPIYRPSLPSRQVF